MGLLFPFIVALGGGGGGGAFGLCCSCPVHAPCEFSYYGFLCVYFQTADKFTPQKCKFENKAT